MKPEETPRYAVNLGVKLGATDVVAKLVDSNKTMLRFAKNEVTVTKSYRKRMITIFVLLKKRRAGSTFSASSPAALEQAVKKLVQMAKITPPADVYAKLPQGPFTYAHTLINPPKVAMNPNKLVDHVSEAIDAATAVGAERVAGSLVANRYRVFLETSNQTSTVQNGSTIEISVRAFTSDVSSGHGVSIAQNEKDFQPADAGKQAGKIAKLAVNPKQGKPGKYLTLLSPLVFADLVNQMGYSASAFLVDSGQSFLQNKMNSHVGADIFTLTDDPTLEKTYGSKAFDDEGVPSQNNVIVEKGMLKSYLHNSTTAKKYGVASTANAGLVVPTPWNLVVKPGHRTFEKILSSIDHGIYVTNDWYLRYQNYSQGDFSTIPRDGMFLIQDGQITSPIKDLRISDNMLRIFQNIQALSSTRFWIKWWEVPIPTLTPYALVKDLTFTRSTM